MFLSLFSPLLNDALLSFTTSLYRLPKQQERDEKSEPFFNPFRSLLLLKESLQTVCNGTNGRHATLQRLKPYPIPLFYHPEYPRPPLRTRLQTPTLFRNFFLKFFYRIFFQKKFFSLSKKRGIYYQSKKIFLNNIPIWIIQPIL